MRWRKEKLKPLKPAGIGAAVAVQTGKAHSLSLLGSNDLLPLWNRENKLYDTMRETVPIIDASINKIIRLVGGFQVMTENQEVNQELQRFCQEVKVGACAQGINQFMYTYLNDLLTYGNAVGEMIPFQDGGGIGALYNASLENIAIRPQENPLFVDMMAYSDTNTLVPVQYQERILFSALNPPSGKWKGRSILQGLTFVTDTLLKIYGSIGENFERMGNLRFAVTYQPQGEIDQENAREIAQSMAEQWAETMRDSDNIKDFVAVGNVDVKVIGAENQIMDSQVPARQMLEQIIAKLGLPPFILGLSWSTTERMSKQQADILTSEMESYRSLLTPIVSRICTAHLNGIGMSSQITVKWNNISITDEVEQAKAELLRAQAAQVSA